jgi:hypothetical protein
VLWDVSTLCAVVPPPGLYGVVGTGVLWDVSTLCAVVPPPGLYGVVGTGVLWDVSTLCAVVPPPGLYGVARCSMHRPSSGPAAASDARRAASRRLASSVGSRALTLSRNASPSEQAHAHTPYSDDKAANRDLRVWHGATKNP